MKKIKLLILLFLINTTFAFADKPSTLIKDIINNQFNNTKDFIIEGTIISKINNNEYMFQDSSAQIKLEVENFAFKDVNELPINTNVKLKITVDKAFPNFPKYKVYEIVSIGDTTNLNQDSKIITDINSIKQTANNNDAFIVQGSIIKTTDGNDNTVYEIQDINGDITPLIIQDLVFQEASLDGFNDNDKVTLKIVINKDNVGDISFHVNKIIYLNNDVNP